MTLRQKQSIFMECLGQLISFAYAEGYELTGGELWRSPIAAEEYAKQGRGIKTSLHRCRLAIDLNLFRDGCYLADSESHRPLGEFWKSLHPLCRWGGDFKRRDGNHYSMTHGGRA